VVEVILPKFHWPGLISLFRFDVVMLAVWGCWLSQMVKYLEKYGLITCGADGNVIIWKVN